MNKYQLKMKTPSGLGTEYVYVESYYDNFERFLEEHNIKYKKYNYKTNQDIEIERLNNRIDKAIEYINKYGRECGNGEQYFTTSTPINYLLNILKGNDTNDKI